MPNIHQEVLIAAPAKTVYDAVTTSEGLSGWWTPNSKATAQLGNVASFPFGPDYTKEMKITALEPNKRVEWLCVKGMDEWVGTTLSFAIEHGQKDALLRAHPELSDQVFQANDKEQTLLIFHHDNWKQDSPMFAECSFTWGRFLTSIKRLCETGKGMPWPNEHRSGS
jgi:uncharacterized protein YndB with AHSA1/START domain